MPEGHTIHRTATLHNQQIATHRIRASSPQGRFTAEAVQLNGKQLRRVEAHGKHLFYYFRLHTLHVHLGLYGKFRSIQVPFPPPRGAVRLRLMNGQRGFDLVGPNRCELLGPAAIQKISRRLVQDPLRSDANPEMAWQRISSSRSAIGRLLLDQSVIAGVGNIYRADALFEAGLHPEQAGNTLTRAEFDTLWKFLQRVMEVGKKYDKIINRRPSAVGKPYRLMKSTERLLVYKQPNCIRCSDEIHRWECGGRMIFACLKCQRLRKQRVR